MRGYRYSYSTMDEHIAHSLILHRNFNINAEGPNSVNKFTESIHEEGWLSSPIRVEVNTGFSVVQRPFWLTRTESLLDLITYAVLGWGVCCHGGLHTWLECH